jgi:hypothetical protein
MPWCGDCMKFSLLNDRCSIPGKRNRTGGSPSCDSFCWPRRQQTLLSAQYSVGEKGEQDVRTNQIRKGTKLE